MGPKKIKTRIESPEAAGAYLKKAKDNYDALVSVLAAKNYNAVGTLAIQCVISAADAVCVYEKGERSISPDHADVCVVMASLTVPGVKEKIALLKRIIAKKNAIQYESRSVYESEARDLAKGAHRFLDWVMGACKDVSC